MNVEILTRIVEIEALVESESMEGAFYKVNCKDSKWACTCPSNQRADRQCKHIQEAQRASENRYL